MILTAANWYRTCWDLRFKISAPHMACAMSNMPRKMGVNTKSGGSARGWLVAFTGFLFARCAVARGRVPLHSLPGLLLVRPSAVF